MGKCIEAAESFIHAKTTLEELGCKVEISEMDGQIYVTHPNKKTDQVFSEVNDLLFFSYGAYFLKGKTC